MSIKPDLLDYIVFFETEPEWIHEMGWFYGARFVTTRGEDTVIATIAPDDVKFSLEWKQADRSLLKFKLHTVSGWLIQIRNGKEQLFLDVTDGIGAFCIVTLKPNVTVEFNDLI
jgi:hypothetical protein